MDTGRLGEEELAAIVEELEPLSALPNPVDLVCCCCVYVVLLGRVCSNG